MITEDHVSFETAKLLKEKRFNEPTERFYNEDGKQLCGVSTYNWNEDEGDFSRPTLWVAMRWLRERNIVICVIPLTFYCGETVKAWGYNIWVGDNLEIDEINSSKFATYEEACDTAIKYCLENLI